MKPNTMKIIVILKILWYQDASCDNWYITATDIFTRRSTHIIGKVSHCSIHRCRAREIVGYNNNKRSTHPVSCRPHSTQEWVLASSVLSSVSLLQSSHSGREPEYIRKEINVILAGYLDLVRYFTVYEKPSLRRTLASVKNNKIH